MSLYEYLLHEYSYACFLADHYHLYPWDSMITNKLKLTEGPKSETERS